MSDNPKEVEYYAAQVNAWLNTKFEHDKSLLTLSAGAIGLLVTLLSATGVKSIETLIMYMLALLAFIVCLAALLWIFRRNAKHLERVVQGKADNDSVLVLLDNTAISSFLLGVLLSSIIGISTAVHSYQEREYKMAQDTSKMTQQTTLRESVNGINNMAPAGVAKLSIEGISQMSPTNATPTPATAVTPPPANVNKEK
jgi:hypothetical protein